MKLARLTHIVFILFLTLLTRFHLTLARTTKLRNDIGKFVFNLFSSSRASLLFGSISRLFYFFSSSKFNYTSGLSFSRRAAVHPIKSRAALGARCSSSAAVSWNLREFKSFFFSPVCFSFTHEKKKHTDLLCFLFSLLRSPHHHRARDLWQRDRRIFIGRIAHTSMLNIGRGEKWVNAKGVKKFSIFFLFPSYFECDPTHKIQSRIP